MNVQELETAVRLKTPFVNVVWENRQYGSIVWKQDKKFGQPLRRRLHQPRLRQARRVVRPAGLALRVGRRLRRAPRATRSTLDVPSLIVLPIDYSTRRCDLRGAGHGDRRRHEHRSTTASEQASLDARPQGAVHRRRVARRRAAARRSAVEDPATGETLCEVADATPDDARAALDAACAGAGRVGRASAARARRDPAPRVRGDHRARRRAGAADDARDGQGARRVEGRDRLRGRVLALVRRGGGADRRPLRDGAQRRRAAADDEAAGRARAC